MCIPISRPGWACVWCCALSASKKSAHPQTRHPLFVFQMSDPFAEPSKYDLTALGYSQAARDSETRSLLATAHGAEDEDDDPKDEVTKEF